MSTKLLARPITCVPAMNPPSYGTQKGPAPWWGKLPLMAQGQSTWRALYKVFLWVVVFVFAIVLIAALRKPAEVAPALEQQTVAASAQDFDAKLQQLADAHQRGESSEARFTAQEVNAVISRTMQENSQPAPVPATAPESASPSTGEPAASDAPTPGTPGGAPIRTVQVALQGSEVTGQFATELYGKEVYITVAGRLGSKDGYATFELTAFKVGDFSMPISLVGETFQKKLAEPENREKLKLPDFIASLRVENGQLVITEK